MERGVRGNLHALCGAGEKLEITSKAYLLLTILGQETEPCILETAIMRNNS